MVLVTEEYRKQLREMHKPQEDGRTWGASACRQVYPIVEYINDGIHRTILDYGSADGKFQKQVRRRGLIPSSIEIIEYDPGIEGKENNNIPCDFVLCSDVLEHIEPELLENVLDDLQRCTLANGYFCIAMYLAKHSLPDGRNAHLIIQPAGWWLEKLSERFKLIEYGIVGSTGNTTLNVYVGVL